MSLTLGKEGMEINGFAEETFSPQTF